MQINLIIVVIFLLLGQAKSYLYNKKISSGVFPKKITPNKLYEMNPKVPGETSSQPSSTNDNSKIELAKFIIGSAIFYLTLQLKIEKAFAKYYPKSENLDATEKLVTGIDFRDIIVGNGQPLRINDKFQAELKLFYNGLPIESEISFESMNTLQQTGEKSIDHIKKGMLGMRKGGRRNIIISSELVRSSKLVKSNLSPEASIIVDVVLNSIVDTPTNNMYL
jgi:FKBP-type peptidyl-prolyl cis-trans isomerase